MSILKLKFLRYFDWFFFWIPIILAFVGLLAIYSSGEFSDLRRQVFSLGIGILVFLFFCFLDPQVFKGGAEIFYAVSLFLLILVANVGYEALGAQRWLSLGGFNFQPSELTKLSLIIMLAKFFHNQEGKLENLLKALPSFILVGVPFFLIFKQPDLGTALVIIFVFTIMLFWAGLGLVRLFLLVSPLFSIVAFYTLAKFSYLAWGIYLAVILLVLIVRKINFFDSLVFFGTNVLLGIFSPTLWNTLAEYQKNRILSFLNPDLDPLARGIRYHTVKATIAVASGQFFGKGLNHGPLTRLHYIPQQHTDFIFSVIGEELGFWGTLLVVVLFTILIYKLIKIAYTTNSTFNTLVAIGIAGMLIFQVFVNIGMNMGIMPIVGIPLPFISYGGSSLITYFAALGIAQSIAMHKSHLQF